MNTSELNRKCFLNMSLREMKISKLCSRPGFASILLPEHKRLANREYLNMYGMLSLKTLPMKEAYSKCKNKECVLRYVNGF